MDYEHGECAREVGTEFEARDGGECVNAPARLRSSLGWVHGDCEQEEARDDYVLMVAMVEERVPVGELQDDSVPHARGVVVTRESYAKASEVEDEGTMPLDVPQKRAYGSLRRSDPHRPSHHARTQHALRDDFVRWDGESEPQMLSPVQGVKAVVLAELSACSKYRHHRRRHGERLCLRFEWARPKDRGD